MQVVALPGGCLARVRIHGPAGHQAVLAQAGKKPRVLALDGDVTAMTRDHGQVLVAAGRQVLTLDPSGTIKARRQVAPGVTALTRAGQGWLVVGYADGNIELWPTDPAVARPKYGFEQVPSSPVLRLLAGPKKTLIAGYADGLVGLWSMEDGKRLEHARIHGPVTHLLMHHRRLLAATDLGQHLQWDLGVFFGDRCALLQGLWKQVNVTWDRGHPVVQKPRADHRCQVRKTD